MNFDELRTLYPRNNWDPVDKVPKDEGGGREHVKLSLHPKVMDKLRAVLEEQIARNQSPFVGLAIEIAYFIFEPVADLHALPDKIARVYDGDLLLLATKLTELATAVEEISYARFKERNPELFDERAN